MLLLVYAYFVHEARCLELKGAALCSCSVTIAVLCLFRCLVFSFSLCLSVCCSLSLSLSLSVVLSLLPLLLHPPLQPPLLPLPPVVHLLLKKGLLGGVRSLFALVKPVLVANTGEPAADRSRSNSYARLPLHVRKLSAVLH